MPSDSPTLLECYSALGPLDRQALAERPELARGLVLNSTFARVDAQVEKLLHYWHDLTLRGQWSEYYWSVTALMLRPATVEWLRRFRRLMHLLPRPKDPLAMARLFDGLLGLDQRDVLGRITCPTLVIGGAEDRIVPAGLQSELAALIPGSRLILYPGYGHGLVKEQPDCEVQTTGFMVEAWRMYGHEPYVATSVRSSGVAGRLVPRASGRNLGRLRAVVAEETRRRCPRRNGSDEHRCSRQPATQSEHPPNHWSAAHAFSPSTLTAHPASGAARCPVYAPVEHPPRCRRNASSGRLAKSPRCVILTRMAAIRHYLVSFTSPRPAVGASAAC